MNVKILCVAFVIFANGIAAAQHASSSNKNPKQAVKEANSKASTTDNGQRYSETLPLPVKLLNTGKSDADAKQDEQERKEKSLNDRLMIYLTGGLFLIAVVQAFMFLRQLTFMRQSLADTKEAADAAKRSADIARDTLTIGERAFVFHKALEAKFLENKRVLSLTIPWENTGNTPTKRLFTHVNWELFQGDMPEHFDFPDYSVETRTRLLIGPKSTIYTNPLNITGDKIDSVLRGEGKIYVWGWAEYDDVFAETMRHRTEFCICLDIALTDPNAPQGQFSLGFPMHTKHNGADQECMKQPTT